MSMESLKAMFYAAQAYIDSLPVKPFVCDGVSEDAEKYCKHGQYVRYSRTCSVCDIELNRLAPEPENNSMWR